MKCPEPEQVSTLEEVKMNFQAKHNTISPVCINWEMENEAKRRSKMAKHYILFLTELAGFTMNWICEKARIKPAEFPKIWRQKIKCAQQLLIVCRQIEELIFKVCFAKLFDVHSSPYWPPKDITVVLDKKNYSLYVDGTLESHDRIHIIELDNEYYSLILAKTYEHCNLHK